MREQVESGQCKRLALVGRTAADVRDVMVEGESGQLANLPPWCRPTYEPSKRRLTWPNGAVATTLRDAYGRDFACVLLSDGCAAFEPRVHDATVAELSTSVPSMTCAEFAACFA